MAKVNIATYQVPQGETELLSSKIELRSPKGGEDIRVHKSWKAPSVAMVRHQSKFYVLDPALRAVLAGRWFLAELRAVSSSKEGFFVWPVRNDADDNTGQAAEAAVAEWTNVEWVTKAKKYTVTSAKESHDEPAWSDVKFEDLLEAALNDRILSNAEDEIVQAIRRKKVQTKKAKQKKEEKKAKAE